MINKTDLRKKIEQCLVALDMYSIDAVNLLMGTAAQESRFKYVRQIGGGPALGYFQMEPATFVDICNNWLQYQDTKLIVDTLELCNVKEFKASNLLFNVKLMICFSRFHYRRVKESIPSDINGYAKYWKKYYNTHLGAGTEDEFIRNYKKYVL